MSLLQNYYFQHGYHWMGYSVPQKNKIFSDITKISICQWLYRTALWFRISIQDTRQLRSDMAQTFKHKDFLWVGVQWLAEVPTCHSTVSRQWPCSWWTHGKKEWIPESPSFGLKQMVYAGTPNSRFFIVPSSVLIIQTAENYSSPTICNILQWIPLNKVFNTNMSENVHSNLRCAPLLISQIISHTYHLTWCWPSLQEYILTKGEGMVGALSLWQIKFYAHNVQREGDEFLAHSHCVILHHL